MPVRAGLGAPKVTPRTRRTCSPEHASTTSVRSAASAVARTMSDRNASARKSAAHTSPITIRPPNTSSADAGPSPVLRVTVGQHHQSPARTEPLDRRPAGVADRVRRRGVRHPHQRRGHLRRAGEREIGRAHLHLRASSARLAEVGVRERVRPDFVALRQNPPDQVGVARRVRAGHEKSRGRVVAREQSIANGEAASSLQTRGLTVISSAGTLVTLLFGLSAGDQDTRLCVAVVHQAPPGSCGRSPYRGRVGGDLDERAAEGRRHHPGRP